MRSKLFVPGSRPELFAKALAGEADALSLDLEDAVPADGKAAARANLVAFLGSDAARAAGQRLIVRVNAPGTPFFREDVAALAGLPIDLVNVPKAEAVAEVVAVAAALTEAGVAAGLLLTIETARGLAHAAALAAAHPAVAGLQVGLNDLCAALDAARRAPAAVQPTLWAIRLAAAEAGVFAYDGAWPDLDDLDGFAAEAALARSLGYLGKSCVHPRQVPLANRLFDRGGAVAEARRLLAAAARAAAAGHGAFRFEGWMVDRPAIAAAEALLAGEGGVG